MPETPTGTGLTVLDMAQRGQFGEIRELFVPSLRPMVTAEALQLAWASAVEEHGHVTAIGVPLVEPAGPGVTAVKVPVTFEHGALTIVLSTTATGELTGIQLAPAEAARPTAAWEPPDYVEPDHFEEHEVTLGSGSLAVSGTLTVPSRTGPFPALVLLAGSGPNDRDETIGRNKPFKDLAWGLATRGVAVLRFDKVTFSHPAEVKQITDFTVIDEYTPAALAAVELLRQHPAIDAQRIFLLGHSLGGTVAPRIAEGEVSIAGVVLLGGGSEPMYWSAVRQLRYLASLEPTTAAASAPAIEEMSERARRVDSPDLSASTPADILPFGVPAPYWLDLRSYDPVATAATLDRPMLILQGGRDYQATVDDDLALWRSGLSSRSNVTIHIYPSDNHFFFTGSGPSTPAEYEPEQHLDEAVVDDIARWLAALRETQS
jgi:dienelactone hydrolase